MYADFASVYDTLADDFDYDAWAKRYYELAPVKKLLECGCGTGSVCLRLAERVPKIIGSDLSPEMLAIAQEKARKMGIMMQFVRQDMREIAMPRPMEAIIVPCDGVNYLHKEEDLLRFFESAKQNLRPGGILAFDYSSKAKLERMLREEIYFEDRDAITLLWRNVKGTYPDSVDMEITCFIRENGGLYKRIDEKQTQKAHDPEKIRELLTKTGYTNIRAFDGLSESPATDKSERILFAANILAK